MEAALTSQAVGFKADVDSTRSAAEAADDGGKAKKGSKKAKTRK